MKSTPKRSSNPRQLIAYISIAVVIVGAIVAVAIASRKDVVPENVTKATGQSHLKVGDTAPPFTIATDAGTFDLAQTSTPALIEVFAPWCPHCQAETVTLNGLSAKYAGKVAFVAVSGDPFDYVHNQPESRENVMQFATDYKVKYPIAFDSQLHVAGLYLRAGFPSIYVVDKNKKIIYQNEGETPAAALDKAIQSALGSSGGAAT